MLKNLGNQKGWQMSSLPYTWPHHTTTPYVEAYVFRSCWVTSNEAPQLHQKKGRFHHVPSSKQCRWVFSWVFQASLMASCITSKFFLGVVPSDRKVNLSSTWSPKKSTMRDSVYCRLMLRCIWHPKKSATFVSPWDLWNSLCTFRSLTVAQRLRDTIKVQIFSACHPQYLSPYHCNSVGWFTRWFTLQWNGRSDDPAVNDKQPPSRLIFQLLPENSGGFVWEAINAGGQRAFVCQVPDGLVLGTNISSCSRTFTHTYICTYFACVCVWVSVLKWRLYASTYCACLIKRVCDSHLFPENSDSTHVDPKFPVKLSPFHFFSCNLPFHQNWNLSAVAWRFGPCSYSALVQWSWNEKSILGQTNRETIPHDVTKLDTVPILKCCCQSLWKIWTSEEPGPSSWEQRIKIRKTRFGIPCAQTMKLFQGGLSQVGKLPKLQKFGLNHPRCHTWVCSPGAARCLERNFLGVELAHILPWRDYTPKKTSTRAHCNPVRLHLCPDMDLFSLIKTPVLGTLFYRLSHLFACLCEYMFNYIHQPKVADFGVPHQIFTIQSRCCMLWICSSTRNSQ